MIAVENRGYAPRHAPSAPRQCGHAHVRRGWVLGGAGLERRYIAWSAVTITSDTPTRAALGLAPMQYSQPISVEVLAPSSWKLDSLPATTPPMALLWSWDIRTITR